MRIAVILLALLLAACGGGGSDGSSSRISVVDGDTVKKGGDTYRLIEYNTGETGSDAACQAEKDIGKKATARLKELLDDADEVKLERVSCRCPEGTEGTDACNHGRYCAFLYLDGKSTKDILISEGLAVEYLCPGLPDIPCPPRPVPWCD